MFTPSTQTFCCLGATRITRPVLPRSLPEMTLTVSSLRILMPMSEDLGGQGDDLHEVALAQLAGHRPEDAGAAGVVGGVDEDGGVLIEADVGAVVAPELLLGAHDHGGHHFALLDSPVRNR